MKSFKSFMIAAAVLVTAPASGQTIDLAAMKCSEYLQTSQDNISVIATWLVGLYTDMSDRPVIDMARLRESSDKLVNFCKKNPNFSVANAAEGILGD